MNESDSMQLWPGRIIAAARVLARLKAEELARLATVTTRTISRIEKSEIVRISPRLRHGCVSAIVWSKIVTALEARGVEIVSVGGDYGAGVRLMKSTPEG